MRELTDHEQNLLSTDQWRPLAFLRGEMLEVTHAELRRWEAHALAVEDQRDKALKARDDVQRLSIERAAEYMTMLGKINVGVDAVIAQRDKAQSQRDGFLTDLERVVAERDALRNQLDDLKSEVFEQIIDGNICKPLRDYQCRIVAELYTKSRKAT